MRLIDADELMNMRFSNGLNEDGMLYIPFAEMIRNIKNVPTAVVHCKDCIHWADMCVGCTEHVKLCTVGSYMVGENGYCVYGEKGIEHESKRKVL